jgi:hypothetical protein
MRNCLLRRINSEADENFRRRQPPDFERRPYNQRMIPLAAGPLGIDGGSQELAICLQHDLPEMLIQGLEREYLAWIFATKSTRSYAIDAATLDEYTRRYSAPGASDGDC